MCFSKAKKTDPKQIPVFLVMVFLCQKGTISERGVKASFYLSWEPARNH